MAHSVGEQAARAVKNSEKKTAAALRTPEERLKDIRNSLAAKLFVTPDDQRWLLDLYDMQVAQNMAQVIVIGDLQAEIGQMKVLGAEVERLKAQIEEFRTVYEQENRSTAVLFERSVGGEMRVAVTAELESVKPTVDEVLGMVMTAGDVAGLPTKAEFQANADHASVIAES